MIIRSMTGFGKAEKEFNGKKFTVEIRSLNSKQLDMSVKLPGAYRSREPEVRQLLAGKISRGKADISVMLEKSEQVAKTEINAELFKDYFKKIEAVAADFGIDIKSPTIVNTILKMPDVICINNTDPDTNEVGALLQCCNDAFNNFDAFRQKEGEALINDISQRVNAIKNGLAKIETYEKGRVDKVRNRIETGLKDVVANNIDKNRLEQELIYYIEKMDITEEKVRLKQHCDHFAATASNDEQPGRKLGFLSQEIGREINTIGSKANDADMQRIVVDMKDELEKIKEQLLNVM